MAGWRSKENTKRKKKRINIPFKRAEAIVEVLSTSESFAIRVFLNDISETGVGIFSSAVLPPEEKVLVKFTQPLEVSLQGTVIWCAPVDTTNKIKSADSFLFRVGIQFNLNDSEIEKSITKLLECIQSLPQHK